MSTIMISTTPEKSYWFPTDIGVEKVFWVVCLGVSNILFIPSPLDLANQPFL